MTLVREQTAIIAAWPLRDDTRAAAQARQLTRGALTALGIDAESVDDAVLMVSELVSNAVLYGDAPFELVLRSKQDELYIEVLDMGIINPVVRTAGVEEEHGRGLGIVLDLSEGRCGCRHGAAYSTRQAHGKAVWFAIPVSCEVSLPRLSGDAA
ncbi:ATP-binding protein [Microbispora amethystogenes]|uniref:ATP-binding protein n=1 Tax=Microbispora amethystogenes TaxID=1427754 RepID=UPI001EF28A5E|nr:ATP-binding protein [Microbispora amethystogenes]